MSEEKRELLEKLKFELAFVPGRRIRSLGSYAPEIHISFPRLADLLEFRRSVT